MYLPDASNDRARAKVELKLTSRPPRVLIRFRDPGKRLIASVTINGREHKAFDAAKEDLDLTGLTGSLDVMVRF
jgi:hypothetical protein